MQPFERLTSVAAPFPFTNVDTDRIIRIERCARTPRHEMGLWAFEMDRFDATGDPRPGFVFHREPFRDARILVAGDNFGCGSSREMAVWAIAGLGVRCVIAPSFGEIFFGNCFENGVLPIRLPAATVEELLARLARAGETGLANDATMTVDLDAQRIDTAWGEQIAFDVEPLRRTMLLQGLDPIGVTLTRAAQIDAYQARARAARPWVYGV